MIELPKVDARSRQDIVAELRALIPLYAPAWNRGPGKPWPAGDPGAALVEIFARFCEIVIERLNRAPDKNFLAFLDMIGVSLLPPMPARAPVRFYLAAGAVADAAVPRALPLATAGPAPQNFETERSLVVTPAQLTSAMTLDSRSDTSTEHGTGQRALVPFAGALLIGHVLYLGHDTVFKIARPTTVAVMFDLGALTASQLPFLTSLLTTLSWWIRKSGQPVRVPGTAVLTTPLGTAFSGATAMTLTGVGTAFTRDLAVGDLIAVPGAGIRKVTTITADTTLTVDAALTVTGPGVTIGRVVGRSLTGTVHTGGASSTTLTGAATHFTTELRAGDRLALPGIGTRTVAAIASDTALTLDAAVSIPGPPGIAAAQVIAPRPVRATAHTAGVTSSSLSGVGTLFTQDLRPGDTLAIPTAGTRVVRTITSDIALTLDAPVTLAGPPGVTLSRVVALRLDVTFTGLAGVEPWTVGGAAAYWLWARSELPLAVSAVLPTVGRAAVRSAIETPVAPDRAFANSAPVDLAKGGFFPFGERPKINDTLYLGSDEVFSKTNARVTLTVTLSFPINDRDGSTDVTITWEFWNHGVWTALGTVVRSADGTRITTAGAQLTDATGGFTVPGTHTLTFLCPEILPSEVNGQKSAWIRARIGAGSYGADARLAPVSGVTTPRTLADWVYTPASFRPPFISDVSLSYAYEGFQDVETVARENAFAIDTVATTLDGHLVPFTPFVPPPDEDPALYLGFDRAFSNTTFTLYLAVGEQVAPPTSPLVAWEYWNGDQWRSLGVFDETKNLTQPGLVESIGPTDFGRQVKFGRDLYWLRARLERGQKERFAIAGIHPNTVWAVQAVTLRGEVLGSGAGKPGQAFTLSRSPVLRGQAIEVREPEPPSPEEVAALEAEGESSPVLIVRDEVRRTSEVWVRWHEVDNFHVSEPNSRHYVVERATGRVQFGDGVRGLIPPPGRDNIRAAQYQAGGGRKGNVAAGAITVMKRAVSSIDRVENPFPASGGADQESLEDVKVRGPLELKHQGRAVAYEDFQWLAQEASIQVALVRCLPASDASTAGSITLLIVPRSDDPKPFPAPGLIRQVQEYLDARRTPTADLAIIGPGYVEVSVTAEVVPVSFDEADLVRRRIVENLTAFLHPLTGGIERRGWAFGRDVFLSEVVAVVEATDGVDHVRRLALSGQAETEDRTRDGGRRVEIRGVPGELPASGTHTVSMSAS